MEVIEVHMPFLTTKLAIKLNGLNAIPQNFVNNLEISNL
jgi:hypothetical protein